jgi:repressor LexA
VLKYIVDFIVANEYPPTLREMGKGLDIRSTNGVNDHLIALERKGWISRGSERSRAVVLTPEAKRKYQFEDPNALALNERRALSKVVQFVRELPEDVVESIKKCETPMQGAMVMLDTVREVLVEDLGNLYRHE